MYGLILKANGSEEPVKVNLKYTQDDFTDGMDVNPDAVADAWPQASFAMIREMKVRSTKTHMPRQAMVVREL
ncbi:hypothetical protein NFO65_00145 [Neorhizobium galegae]|uniref:hypothetical protein n=1 Tax=Neorhizobium galegae TaxID=399 RepID=UPI002101BEAE|nr:hypothetical protein [Neorhizobium galegae]MCQ1569147.1 hypothetical protein [Neorhizobium galegae]